MQVIEDDKIKIYNLSVGKSLPDWLSDRKRRALQKRNVDIRRRIELIQDFSMPGVSTQVKISKDGNYVLATGIYKPRVKCFDVNNLSLKFERCFDSEAVAFEILSDDYSKLVFLQNDRYIEFHAAHGKYYRLRIPKYGRDMCYHYPTCDLYLVGSTSSIYRLNMERGQFQTPYTSRGSAINKCIVNKEYNLILCGTEEGTVEAWDPRSKSLAGVLDCAVSCVSGRNRINFFPSISALQIHGGINLGVGTKTGQVLLYDIRSDKPSYIKNHHSEDSHKFPILDIEFHKKEDLVYSMNSSFLKIWNKDSGKEYTHIEAVNTKFNNLCLVPDSGLLFIANENTKIQTYFIPSLGKAPKWAHTLDNIVEELEESKVETVYDDYQFVSKEELINLGLDHLIGTNILRAHSHGYYMDIRLYKKAKDIGDPFEYDEFKKKKIKEKIDTERINRVKVDKLPAVNKDLALKLLDKQPKSKKSATNPFEDTRFKQLFENPDFEIDKTTEDYRLLNPVLSKLDRSQQKQQEKLKEKKSKIEKVEEEPEGKGSSDEWMEIDTDENEESSDDDQYREDIRKEYRQITKERWEQQRGEDTSELKEIRKRAHGKIHLEPSSDFSGLHKLKKERSKATLGERLEKEAADNVEVRAGGNRQMVFSSVNKKKLSLHEKNKLHKQERMKVVRSTKNIKFKKKFK